MAETPIRPGHPGYDLSYRFQDAPTPDELREFREAAVAIRTPDEPIEQNETLVARLGTVRLTCISRPTQEQMGRLRPTPVLCERRGTRGDPIGIDTEIWTGRPLAPDHSAGPPPSPAAGADKDLWIPKDGLLQAEKRRGAVYPTLQTLLARIGAIDARPLRHAGVAKVVVAVIDTELTVGPSDKEEFPPPRVGPVEDVYFPRALMSPRLETRGNHGDLMTRVVVDTLAGTHAYVRRIRVPPHASSYLAPTDLAMAVAEAVEPRGGDAEAHPADVVLIPMSSGRWGMPPHLDAMLVEAARTGRGGRGVVIVCSTGRPDDNQDTMPRYSWPSAALGADELGSHPDVLLVGPCDLAGRWLRRYGERLTDEPPDALRLTTGISGRMGPAVDIAAPGVCSVLHERGGLTDESSLASALVAGVAALVLQANPSLTAREVRTVLRQTALIPRDADAPYGPEAAGCSNFGRDGHNFKVGAGMVNALAATLAARDPVCQALLQAAVPAPPPPELDALLADPALLIARWFDHWTLRYTGNHPIAAGYREHRSGLARLLLRSGPLREDLGWVLRHLFAIFTYDGGNRWYSPSVGPQANHGALRRRLRRVTQTLRAEVTGGAGPGDVDREPLAAWAGALDASLEKLSDAALEALLLGAFLGYGVDHGKSDLPPSGVPYRQLERRELGV
ncbi:predicted subtilisin like protease [Sorangium cellulosum So ce56]|uniref:Predicted subtilisin like protease n=1 Tax=Sorangium cellulosum (strain So ce56) TaxID=448385 RepID=A9GJ73_SORC5|nr:S8/S53 family peptidase [Sorangium cellulosum]CAN93365.1 predicted subtilisin like protease [Sorangium cellulosum So ce56]